MTQSQQAYASAGWQGRGWHRAPAQPCFLSSSTGPCIRRRAGRTAACLSRHPAGLPVQGQPQRPGLPGTAARARGCGKPCWNTASSGRRHRTVPEPCGDHARTPGGHIRSGCSLPPGSIRFTGRRQIRQPCARGPLPCRAQGCSFVHPDTGKPMAFSLPLPAAAPWKEFLE